MGICDANHSCEHATRGNTGILRENRPTLSDCFRRILVPKKIQSLVDVFGDGRSGGKGSHLGRPIDHGRTQKRNGNSARTQNSFYKLGNRVDVRLKSKAFFWQRERAGAGAHRMLNRESMHACVVTMVPVANADDRRSGRGQAFGLMRLEVNEAMSTHGWLKRPAGLTTACPLSEQHIAPFTQ